MPFRHRDIWSRVRDLNPANTELKVQRVNLFSNARSWVHKALLTPENLATPRGVEPLSPARQAGIMAVIRWGRLVDPEGFEPSLHGLKVRTVTVTPRIRLVGRSGVDPDSSGLQPDAFTGLAFSPFKAAGGSAFPHVRPKTLDKECLLCSIFLAPSEGLEPSTSRLTAVCSAG